jgi:hypothetical protein
MIYYLIGTKDIIQKWLKRSVYLLFGFALLLVCFEIRWLMILGGWLPKISPSGYSYPINVIIIGLFVNLVFILISLQLGFLIYKNQKIRLCKMLTIILLLYFPIGTILGVLIILLLSQGSKSKEIFES